MTFSNFSILYKMLCSIFCEQHIHYILSVFYFILFYGSCDKWKRFNQMLKININFSTTSEWVNEWVTAAAAFSQQLCKHTMNTWFDLINLINIFRFIFICHPPPPTNFAITTRTHSLTSCTRLQHWLYLCCFYV